MTHRTRYIGLAALFACGGSRGDKPVATDSIALVSPNDSLVLTNATGVEIWYTLARPTTRSDGSRCVERGLEIRHQGRQLKVPLLYTGTPPVLLNDSTMRAILWNRCQPGDPYLVNLRSGQPVRERQANGS